MKSSMPCLGLDVKIASMMDSSDSLLSPPAFRDLSWSACNEVLALFVVNVNSS